MENLNHQNQVRDGISGVSQSRGGFINTICFFIVPLIALSITSLFLCLKGIEGVYSLSTLGRFLSFDIASIFLVLIFLEVEKGKRWKYIALVLGLDAIYHVVSIVFIGDGSWGSLAFTIYGTLELITLLVETVLFLVVTRFSINKQILIILALFITLSALNILYYPYVFKV